MHKDLRNLIASGNSLVVGKAAADLAQIIWNDQIEEPELIRLLQDDNDLVRGAVSWAIADALRPPYGVTWLIRHGLWDKYERVRVYAICALADWTGKVEIECKARVVQMLHDESEVVRRLARELVAKWESS